MFTDVKQVQSYIKSVANSVKLVVLDANLSVKVLPKCHSRMQFKQG